MDKEIQIFKNEEFGQVRTVLFDNEPYFVGEDVVKALGYDLTNKSYTKYINKYVDEESSILIDKNSSPEWARVLDYKELGQRGGYIIDEYGLYDLVLDSPLPTAKKFRRWVTSEILPSIRKHGAYMTENTLEEALTNPDFLIKLATELKEEQSKRKALEEEKKLNAPKVVFADAVATSKTSILVRELAKILKQNGVDAGQDRLFDWLRSNGYLIKKKGTDYNMPTQKSVDLGIFEVKETSVTHSDGHITVNKTPKVTGKGQQYFINKFLNKEV